MAITDLLTYLPAIILLAPAAAYSNPNNTTYQFTTDDGLAYFYDYIPAQANKSTILLLHGYPSSRHDWHFQIEDLPAAAFGVIAPDCLGYGDSDKPVEIEAYNLKRLAVHLMEILDHEALDTVIGVGHDWGATLLSRTSVWYPTRFQKLAFLSIGYSAPGIFLDIDAMNAFSFNTYGYMQFGYCWQIHKLESYYHLAFYPNATAWAGYLAGLGTARAWLLADTRAPIPYWPSHEHKQQWLKNYSRPKAVAASLNYYRAVMRGVQAEDEEAFIDETRTVKVPVLTIGGTRDTVTRSDQIRAQTKPWANGGYTEKTVDAGHWMMLERREEISAILLRFFQ